jgi:hypothetical protein
VISNALQLKDGGLVLQQVELDFQAVAIHDVYGTINVDKGLKWATHELTTALNLPSGLAIPFDLPDVSVTMANASSAMGNNVWSPSLIPLLDIL